ncbi:MAG: nuclear transport factor 2 family protein [Sphingobacterium sp.]
MKTLVKTFAAAALIAVSTFAMAAEGPGAKATKANVNLSTADLALDHYVAVTTEGESAGVEQLFAEDFNQKIQASNTQSNSRSAVVKLLKKQKGEKLNCTVSTDIIEESADYMVAKVTLKFENFTKTDLVTLERVGNDWKVSKSINSYK